MKFAHHPFPASSDIIFCSHPVPFAAKSNRFNSRRYLQSFPHIRTNSRNSSYSHTYRTPGGGVRQHRSLVACHWSPLQPLPFPASLPHCFFASLLLCLRSSESLLP